MSSIIDTSGSKILKDEILIDERELTVSLSRTLTPCNLVYVENINRYSIITRSIEKERLVPRVIVPIKFIDGKDVPTLYDIDVINTSDLLKRSEKPIPFIITKLKRKYQDEIAALNSTFDSFRFRDVAIFIYAIKIVAESGGLVISSVPLIEDANVLSRKRVDMSKLGERNLIEIFKKIKDINIQNSMLQNVKTFYVESDVDSIPPEYEHNLPGPYKDSKVNYSRVLFPLLPMEREVYSLGLMLFSAQYYHPYELIQDVLSHIPSIVSLDSGIINEVMENSTVSSRTPRLLFGCSNLLITYASNGIMDEYRKIIKDSVDVTLITQDPAKSRMGIQRLIMSSITTQRAGDEIVDWVRLPAFSEFIINSFSIMINPNLYIITGSMRMIMSFFSESIYHMLSLFIAQLLIPPNVFTIDYRISINNMLARYIMEYKVPDSKRHLFTAIPMLDDISGWMSISTDYLAMLYCTYGTILKHQCGQSGENAYMGMKYYFHGASAMDVTGTFSFPDGMGGSTKVQQSLCIPYLNGKRTYNYAQNADYSNARETLYKMGNGIIIPTEYNNGDPNLQYYKNKINSTQHLLLNNVKRNPSFPTEVVTTSIIEAVKSPGAMKFRQIYLKYIENLAKFSLMPACDPIVRPNIKITCKKNLEIDLKGILVAPFMLEQIYELQPVSLPILQAGIPVSTRIAFFIKVYREIYTLTKTVNNDVIPIKGGFSKRRMIELSIDVTRSILKDKDFDPIREAVGAHASTSDINELLNLEIDPILLKPLDAFMKAVNTVRVSTTRNESKLSLVKSFYIVKNAFSSSLAGTTGSTYIVGANTVLESSLRVVKRYVNLTAFSRALNEPERIENGFIDFNEFDGIVSTLKCPDDRSMATDGLCGVIDAIRVDAPIYVDINLYKVGTTPEILQIKSPKLNEVTNIYKTFIRDPNLQEIPRITFSILLNDLGMTFNNNLAKKEARIATIESLSGSQIVVPLDGLLDTCGVNIMSPDNFLSKIGCHVPLRTTPFDIWDGVELLFENTQSHL